MLQRKAANNDEFSEVPPIVREVLQSPGQSLDPAARAFFEPRFGHDFSHVRIHSDGKADKAARAANALSFAFGEHIAFEAGQYAPESTEGTCLLAHELTHVLQQRDTGDRAHTSGGVGGPIRVTHLDQPQISRQGAWYPGVISRCREMGVPCPAPHFTHGTVCRLADCIPSSTARLPGAISPGVCIYHCEDGRICACVLVGTRTSAVCTFTFCTEPGQAAGETDTNGVAEQAMAMAEERYGTGETAGGPESVTPSIQAKLKVTIPGDPLEQEADRVADQVLGESGKPSMRSDSVSLHTVDREPIPLSRACSPLLQRQGGGAAPACPAAVNFTFTQPAHVPHCGGPALRATTNVAGIAWSLTPGTAPVDPGSSIAPNGTITLAATQAAGDINARATATALAAGGCFTESSFSIRSHPVSIASTSFVAPAAAGDYGGSFDHVFDSADGNAASLENVGVGERFTNVPNPAGAAHNIVAPLNPFGGTFTLNTATLTPGAANNWFLTAAGGLNGNLDNVTTGKGNVNVGRFVQSASMPAPPQGLPASMTLLQNLRWFCPQAPAPSCWTGFVTVPHSRTLRNVGGTIEFVTAVNAVEQVDTYVGPSAVFNLTATPASTPRSLAPLAGGGGGAAPGGGGAAPPAARTVSLHSDSLPDALPAGQTLNWSIVGNAQGCAVAVDPTDSHNAALTVGTTAGTVNVQAADSTNTNRARVPIVIT